MTTISIPTIETERLIMRAPHWADFEPYAAFGASERSKTVGGPYTRGQSFTRLSGLIGHWHLRGYGRWMLTDKQTGVPLGVVGLLYPEGWPEPEIGWSLFAEAEGKGIAYEAALRTRQYAYETLGWRTVVSCVAPDNPRSLALAKRLRCTPENAFEHEEYGALHIWRHPGADA